jgi:bifunctional DNase/RNase
MRTKKVKENEKFKMLLILITLTLAVSLFLNVYNFYFQKQPQIPTFKIEKSFENIVSNLTELSTIGFVKIENVSVNQFLDHSEIVLSKGCKGLIGSVENMQGQSILNGINGIVSVRPNTHDLIKDMFGVLDVKVLMVKIVGIKGNNYIGRLVIQHEDKIVSLDSRPSDGIAVALRVNAPIYVNSTLFSEKAQNIC